jgi:predicted acyl esterase
VSEPWSDGRIGATGISYLGAAADFLASTGHPAVKAIAPLFSVWDTYGDHYYPGGACARAAACASPSPEPMQTTTPRFRTAGRRR